MRIATWNVNSLNARIEKVWWWLERAQPDVLLMQETKLADEAAPAKEFAERLPGRVNKVFDATLDDIDRVNVATAAPLPEGGNFLLIGSDTRIFAGAVRRPSITTPRDSRSTVRSSGTPLTRASYTFSTSCRGWVSRAASSPSLVSSSSPSES